MFTVGGKGYYSQESWDRAKNEASSCGVQPHPKALNNPEVPQGSKCSIPAGRPHATVQHSTVVFVSIGASI
jgi:hypothetical protein